MFYFLIILKIFLLYLLSFTIAQKQCVRKEPPCHDDNDYFECLMKEKLESSFGTENLCHSIFEKYSCEEISNLPRVKQSCCTSYSAKCLTKPNNQKTTFLRFLSDPSKADYPTNHVKFDKNALDAFKHELPEMDVLCNFIISHSSDLFASNPSLLPKRRLSTLLNYYVKSNTEAVEPFLLTINSDLVVAVYHFAHILKELSSRIKGDPQYFAKLLTLLFPDIFIETSTAPLVKIRANIFAVELGVYLERMAHQIIGVFNIGIHLLEKNKKDSIDKNELLNMIATGFVVEFEGKKRMDDIFYCIPCLLYIVERLQPLYMNVLMEQKNLNDLLGFLKCDALRQMLPKRRLQSKSNPFCSKIDKVFALFNFKETEVDLTKAEPKAHVAYSTMDLPMKLPAVITSFKSTIKATVKGQIYNKDYRTFLLDFASASIDLKNQNLDCKNCIEGVISVIFKDYLMDTARTAKTTLTVAQLSDQIVTFLHSFGLQVKKFIVFQPTDFPENYSNFFEFFWEVMGSVWPSDHFGSLFSNNKVLFGILNMANNPEYVAELQKASNQFFANIGCSQTAEQIPSLIDVLPLISPDSHVEPTKKDNTPVPAQVEPTKKDNTPIPAQVEPTKKDSTPLPAQVEPTKKDNTPIPAQVEPIEKKNTPLPAQEEPIKKKDLPDISKEPKENPNIERIVEEAPLTAASFSALFSDFSKDLNFRCIRDNPAALYKSVPQDGKLTSTSCQAYNLNCQNSDHSSIILDACPKSLYKACRVSEKTCTKLLETDKSIKASQIFTTIIVLLVVLIV